MVDNVKRLCSSVSVRVQKEDVYFHAGFEFCSLLTAITSTILDIFYGRQNVHLGANGNPGVRDV